MLLLCSDEADILQRWHDAVAIVSGLSVDILRFTELNRSLPQNPEALVLLDLRLPGLHEGDGVEALIATHHSARLLMFSRECDDREGVKFVRLGVRAYLPLDSIAETVARAIRTVLAGELWASRRLLRLTIESCREDHLLGDPTCSDVRLSALTHRQQEVSIMVSKGLTNKQIAQRLGLTEATVKAHLSAIFERTKTRTRTELALYMRDGLDHASS